MTDRLKFMDPYQLLDTVRLVQMVNVVTKNYTRDQNILLKYGSKHEFNYALLPALAITLDNMGYKGIIEIGESKFSFNNTKSRISNYSEFIQSMKDTTNIEISTIDYSKYNTILITDDLRTQFPYEYSVIYIRPRRDDIIKNSTLFKNSKNFYYV